MRTLALSLTSAALLLGVAQPALGSSQDLSRLVPASTDNVHIRFNPGTAPCTFDSTSPLTDAYASLGVHFAGPADGEGGAILNQCGRFGIRARSGQEFLAFNSGTYAQSPETITFDNPVKRVSMFIANGTRGASTFKLIAMRGGEAVTRTTVVANTAFYTQISVRAKLGIDSVMLKGATPDGTWVVDDMGFTPMGQ